MNISALKADITTLAVDAIVNAANNSLLGGGGVDGAIHRVAGPQLLKECRALGGCLTGEAKITGGYNLPAQYVIHTVGPIWGRCNGEEDNMLASCYQNSLRLAEEHELKSIAFPGISTGIYGFPKDRACHIAFKTVSTFESKFLKEVTFCSFDDESLNLYLNLLQNHSCACGR